MAVRREKTMRLSNLESWILMVQISTKDTKSFKTIPVNLTNRFVVMEVYYPTGGSATVVTASTNCSNSAMANALEGKAILSFPLTATKSVTEGLYRYSVYVSDFPYMVSATYAKQAITGPLEVFK